MPPNEPAPKPEKLPELVALQEFRRLTLAPARSAYEDARQEQEVARDRVAILAEAHEFTPTTDKARAALQMLLDWAREVRAKNDALVAAEEEEGRLIREKRKAQEAQRSADPRPLDLG